MIKRIPILFAILLSVTNVSAQTHQKPVTLMPTMPRLGQARHGTNALHLNNVEADMDIVVQVGTEQWQFETRHENEHLIMSVSEPLPDEVLPFQVCAWQVGKYHQRSCVYVQYDEEWERSQPLPVNALGFVWVDTGMLQGAKVYMPVVVKD